MITAVSINYWAVLVATIAVVAIGALWYAPFLFGNVWLKLIGKKREEVQQNVGLAYGATTLAALVMVYILDHFVQYVSVITISAALQLAFWLWLGFIVCTTASDYIFAGRPFKLYLLNKVYYLIALGVAAAILVSWK